MRVRSKYYRRAVIVTKSALFACTGCWYYIGAPLPCCCCWRLSRKQGRGTLLSAPLPSPPPTKGRCIFVTEQIVSVHRTAKSGKSMLIKLRSLSTIWRRQNEGHRMVVGKLRMRKTMLNIFMVILLAGRITWLYLDSRWKQTSKRS